VQVVLVTKTLVSRDQDFVAIEHRDCEQIAVFELVPSFFENCVDFHARRVSAGAGRAYPGRTESSCRGLEFEARGCEFKHGFSLFPVDPWKPLDELIDGCSVFKIFKQGSHWNPRVGKHPSAAHLLRIALDRSAFCPGTHPSVSPGDHGNPEPKGNRGRELISGGTVFVLAPRAGNQLPSPISFSADTIAAAISPSSRGR
jgi:hypothetical protein